MKGVQFSMKGIRKGYIFKQKWYIKGPRRGASTYETLVSDSWYHLGRSGLNVTIVVVPTL